MDKFYTNIFIVYSDFPAHGLKLHVICAKRGKKTRFSLTRWLGCSRNDLICSDCYENYNNEFVM